jgi:hypothetical protein
MPVAMRVAMRVAKRVSVGVAMRVSEGVAMPGGMRVGMSRSLGAGVDPRVGESFGVSSPARAQHAMVHSRTYLAAVRAHDSARFRGVAPHIPIRRPRRSVPQVP